MNPFIISKENHICSICIADTACDTAVTAAGELVRCLRIQSGCEPAVYTGKPQKGDICLGAYSDTSETEELRIQVQDGILWIDGGVRGIIYGAYELLEQLGCRFFTKDCEVLPTSACLAVPGDLSISQKPVFEYRHAYWNGITPEFAPKMRINGLGESMSASWGGGVCYEGYVHTLGELSEMEGDFTDRQPCLTEEKTFRTVVKNLRKKLQNNPGADIASVSQNDSHDWGRGCNCPACQAMDEAEGTPMGSLLPFVNRVAKELEEDYPNLAIDTLAYRYTRKAPKTLTAAENVIVRLCSIECCFSHPIESCHYTAEKVEDVSFAETLQLWGEHCKRIYIWDYTTNFSNYNSSFPNFGVLRQNLRFFAKNHVKGVFEQGNMESPNGEFGDLRTYLLSKLLWDPYMSEETYQRHINEFLEGYYGPGAPHIRRFFDRLQKAAQGVHFGIYFTDPTRVFQDPDMEGSLQERAESFLKKGREDFAAAMTMADSVQRARIRQAEIQLDLYEWFLLYHRWQECSVEDGNKMDAEKALKDAGIRLHALFLSYGITRTDEGGYYLPDLRERISL